MGKYWLGKSKPKQVFRSTWDIYFQKVAMDLKENNLADFSTDRVNDYLIQCTFKQA